MVTDQVFHSQTVESASCGLVDSREPCCYEPPEENTGSVINELFFGHSYIRIFDADAISQGKDFH